MKVSKSFFRVFIRAFLVMTASALFADTTHLVEKGETLYSISRKYQITVSELRAANGLSESDVLKFGQKLNIPTPDIENAATLNSASLSSGSSYSSENLETYVAQKGDTYYGIARERGIKVAELFALNNLGSDASLKAGQKLKVPAKASSAAQTVALDLKDADPRKYSSSKASSGLVWPVKNPRITYVNGKVSGVQLSAAKKEKIMNIMAGTVMYCGSYRGFGEVVFVQSKTGLIYAYTGMSSVSVQKGDYVVYGDTIGTAGVDSISKESRLTLMVFRNGSPIDPATAPRG
ncbi:MAG: M23 family metallopeptidase [Treponema sp.]|nr:M23 family metallopeptidase [Treponema sp.]MEE3436053.1 M23 family metallopeptidase [Treponema sp.]